MTLTPDDPKTNKQPRKETVVGLRSKKQIPADSSIPDNTAWLDSLLNEIWAIVKKDSLASSHIGSPAQYTRDAMQQAILSHFGTSDSKSISEMREQIMELLGLEKDLQGQIVLKDIEDVQSNWEYVVEAILSYMLTSSNKKPGEDISKPGDASNIVAALEEIKKVGLEFDKNFSGTVAYNCLLNRIADMQHEASESQPVNNQVADPSVVSKIDELMASVAENQRGQLSPLTPDQWLWERNTIIDLFLQGGDSVSGTDGAAEGNKTDYNLDEVSLCNSCGAMKHVDQDGYCGRCNRETAIRIDEVSKAVEVAKNHATDRDHSRTINTLATRRDDLIAQLTKNSPHGGVSSRSRITSDNLAVNTIIPPETAILEARIDEVEMALSITGITNVGGVPMPNLEGSEGTINPDMLKVRLKALQEKLAQLYKEKR